MHRTLSQCVFKIDNVPHVPKTRLEITIELLVDRVSARSCATACFHDLRRGVGRFEIHSASPVDFECKYPKLPITAVVETKVACAPALKTAVQVDYPFAVLYAPHVMLTTCENSSVIFLETFERLLHQRC